MDDPLKLPQLIEAAQLMDLSQTFEWIRAKVYGLPAGSRDTRSRTPSSAIPSQRAML
jgi:hypothetical protein